MDMAIRTEDAVRGSYPGRRTLYVGWKDHSQCNMTDALAVCLHLEPRREASEIPRVTGFSGVLSKLLLTLSTRMLAQCGPQQRD